MKQILIDLKAIGHPIDSIQPVVNITCTRNILTDDVYDLICDLKQLITNQFSDTVLECLFERSCGLDWTAACFEFGCNMIPHDFRALAHQFFRNQKAQDSYPSDEYILAPDESDPTDTYFTCRAANPGFILTQSGAVLLSKNTPGAMLDDIFASDCSEYAILTIN